MVAQGSPSYFLSKSGEVYGPLVIEEISARIRDGRITSREWIFLPDPGEWYPLVEIPQMSSGFYSVLEKPSAPPALAAGPVPSAGTLAHAGSEKVEFGGQVVEKRRWVRLPSPLSLRFALDLSQETAQKIFEVVTDDISEGGLGFRWSLEIPIGTFMRVDLDIFPNLLKTKGRVSRCRSGECGAYSIGVLFVSLTEQDRKNLRSFLVSATS